MKNLTIIIIFLIPNALLAYTGTYFSAEYINDDLQTVVFEPYFTSCDNFGDYVPLYFNALDDDEPMFGIEQCGGNYNVPTYSNTSLVRVVMVYDPFFTFWYSGQGYSYNQLVSTKPISASFVDNQIITQITDGYPFPVSGNISAQNTRNQVLNTGFDFGTSMLVILGVVIGIGVGFLVFHIGWKYLKDNSFTIGGYYLKKLPYKAYNRYRSKQLNNKNTS